MYLVESQTSFRGCREYILCFPLASMHVGLLICFVSLICLCLRDVICAIVTCVGAFCAGYDPCRWYLCTICSPGQFVESWWEDIIGNILTEHHLAKKRTSPFKYISVDSFPPDHLLTNLIRRCGDVKMYGFTRKKICMAPLIMMRLRCKSF